METSEVEQNAKRQALVRNVNEDISAIERRFGGSVELRIICECGRADCAKLVAVPRELYEAVRREATHFVVLPGHERMDVERVIACGSQRDFLLVRNIGRAAEIARATNPRLDAET
jgi:hypothetical protein